MFDNYVEKCNCPADTAPVLELSHVQQRTEEEWAGLAHPLDV